MQYKFVISCAGIGERVSSFAGELNKSLLTVGRKPVISHIIDKIDQSIEIVICLGYKSDSLKQFIDLCYPERNITYVYIDKFEGVGSGLTYTLLQAKNHLQCPFIFSSNDTIIDGEYLEPKFNYTHYSQNNCDLQQYRTLSFNDEKELLSVNDKGQHSIRSYPYIGLCGIYDYSLFWNLMEKCEDMTIGESYALSKMLKTKKIKCIPSHWYDTGNKEELKKSLNSFQCDDGINVLEKTEEKIWFVKDVVIKYHKDPNFILDRVKRCESLGEYVPDISNKSKNFFTYKKINGYTFTYEKDRKRFSSLLSFLKDFWSPLQLSTEQIENFKKVCFDFYKKKTYDRIESFFDLYGINDIDGVINGVHCPTIDHLLNDIDWSYISNGTPVRYHGDLHFENIITDGSYFKLIDWRQNFGGILEYGDIYYDLAKIKHGLIISHDVVGKNLFEVSNDMKNFSFMRTDSSVEYERQFDLFIGKNGYDLYKVDILTALIYLNVASLHHNPYSKFLFCLGKYMLTNLLSEQKQKEDDKWKII